MCLSDGFTKEMKMQTPRGGLNADSPGWDWGHALTLTNYLSIFLLSKESGIVLRIRVAHYHYKYRYLYRPRNLLTSFIYLA